MKSKKSLFSGVLIKEDLKRFAPIPAIMFFLYFLIYGMQLLKVNGKEGFVGIPDYFYRMYDDRVQAVLLCITAVLCAVSVFAYLHNKASATAAHAMPFQRKTIFASHCLAGGILTAAPVVLSALTFILICAAQTAAGNRVYSVDPAEPANFAAIYMAWLAASLVTLFFVYAVSVLAAVIAGTIFTHILLAMFLNGIVPVTIYVVNEYLRQFWPGLSVMPLASVTFSPVSRFFCGYYYITLKTAVPYVAVAAVLILLSGLLYKRIQLERENSSVVFNAFGEIVCMLFAFIGMTVGGFTGQFIMNTESLPVFFLFAFAGALLFYLIGRMILEKKLQVFTLAAWKKFGVFLAAAALFCAFTVFDITGFVEKVPDAEDVKSVSIDAPVGTADDYAVFSEEDSIEQLVALHRLLIKEYTGYHNDYHSGDSVLITYELKNGRQMQRVYSVDLINCQPVFEIFKELYETEEFKSQLKAAALVNTYKIQKLLSIETINDDNPYAEYYIPKEKQDAFMAEFKAAVLKDESDRTYYQTLCKTVPPIFEEDGYDLIFRTEASPSYQFFLLKKYDKNAVRVLEKYMKIRYGNGLS